MDSLEHITHSLCTLEFEVRRDPYYWILNALDLYRPNVWEFSRLNLTTNVMSKRRLNKLVTQNYVDGWDDPRILTVDGLKRRGYTPAAINNFCKTIGVTRTENLINIQLLEHFCRQDLDTNASRAFAVLNPLKITLSNVAEDRYDTINAPNFPADPSKGTHPIVFSRTIYIDRSDFRLQDSKEYYGLAPGKEVFLKYAYNIKCEEVKMSKPGSSNVDDVLELVCSVDFKNSNKVKGSIHWIARPSPSEETPRTAEIRIYDYLFNHENPSAEEDWLNFLNPNSKKVIPNAMIDTHLFNTAKAWEKFQFERVGFFSVDPDSVLTSDPSTTRKLVFNSTVTLKQSKEKRSLDKAMPSASSPAAAAPTSK